MESFQCVPSICLLMLQAAVYSVWCTAWAILTCHKEHHSQRCQLVCRHLPTGNLSTTCVLHFFCISIFNSYIYIWIFFFNLEREREKTNKGLCGSRAPHCAGRTWRENITIWGLCQGLPGWLDCRLVGISQADWAGLDIALKGENLE